MSPNPIEDYHVEHPWLDSAGEALEELGLGNEEMFRDAVKAQAIRNILDAAEAETESELTLPEDIAHDGSVDSEDKLLSYPLSRILLSLLNENRVTEAFGEFHARKAETELRSHVPKNTDDPFDFDPDLKLTKPLHFGHVDEQFGLDLQRLSPAEIIASSSASEDWAEMDPEARKQLLMEGYDIDKTEIRPSSLELDSIEDAVNELSTSVFSDMFRDVDYYSVSVESYLDAMKSTDKVPEELDLSSATVTDGRVILEYDELIEVVKILVTDKVSGEIPLNVPSSIADKLEYLNAALIQALPQEMTETTDVRSFPLLDTERLPSHVPMEREKYSDYSPLGSDEVNVDMEEVQEHYKRAERIYVALGVVDGSLHTSWLGSEQHSGWYVNERLESRSENPEAWDAGFPNVSRPSILPDDFDHSVTGRSVYTTNSYSPREAYKERYYKIEDGDQHWMDEELEDMEEITRLPQYGDLGAYSLIVDIDLEDEWKSRPLPDDYKEIVEGRLNAWIGAFSQILGGAVEDVFVVDSGGGAYVMTPPAATMPIAEEFDREKRDIINNELNNRMRTLTDVLDEIITSLDEAPNDLFSGDIVQNKNRQWKTLLSLHASLDNVVHPIDPTDPSYDSLSFQNLTEEDYEEAFDWAKRFTQTEYKEHIQELVEALFQSDVFEQEGISHEKIEGDHWTEILENFIEKRKEERKRQEEARKLIEKQDGSIEDVGVTTDKVEIDAAIAAVDLKKYLKANHVQEWDTDNRSDQTTSFSPKTWRSPSPKANSCFYSPNGGQDGSPIFRDRKEGWTAGIIDLIACEEGLTDHPSETPTGGDWWEAVEALRERGENIPVWLPDIESDSYPSDKLGKDKLADAALALETATEDQIEEREGEYGPYKEITDKEAYNATLDELEERGISHGRQRRS